MGDRDIQAMYEMQGIMYPNTNIAVLNICNSIYEKVKKKYKGIVAKIENNGAFIYLHIEEINRYGFDFNITFPEDDIIRFLKREESKEKEEIEQFIDYFAHCFSIQIDECWLSRIKVRR